MRQLAGLFPAIEYPDLLVGLGEPDDAAVYRLDDTHALITTTDFFTPIVDDPWTYGAIAAANAMSDVYAMGGDVVFCLNIAGFPEELPTETMAQIFAGGAAKVREAQAAIAGGHTVTNPEPFYGLSVTGTVHPDYIMRKGGARPGDRLYLTKPLGTGIVTTAAKLTGGGEQRAHRLARRMQGKPDLAVEHLDAAIASMLRLNRAAAQAARAVQIRGATDITGFGLLGHASEMAAGSRSETEETGTNASQPDGGPPPASHSRTDVVLRIQAEAVPVLPGVWGYIQAGYLTRGSTRNPAAFGEHIRIAPHISPALTTLLWESETSGGLLLAVPAAQATAFEEECRAREQPFWVIGDVVPGDGREGGLKAGVQVV